MIAAAIIFSIGLVLTVVGGVLGRRALHQRRDDVDWPAIAPDEELVIEAVAAMRNTPDWIDERVEDVVATHMAAGIASGSRLYEGRHRAGFVALVASTQEFRAITAGVFDTREYADLARLVEEWRCDPCRTGNHADCPGCACPLHEMAVAR